MNKETKHAVIVVIAAFVTIIAIFGGISSASGVSPFQTVVESGSMQHGIGSQIGVIDTGDVIILKNKEKVNIQTYVDGYHTGYMKFGGYGDVIIYDRGPDYNPVIHRAILWLDYNNDGTWNAPSLEFFPYGTKWSCTSGNDFMALSGTLTLYGLGYKEDRDASVSLTELAKWSKSGYLTMGDYNPRIDQPSNIPGVNGLISYEQIRSVAWFEIPWLGAIKMTYNGNGNVLDVYVPNTKGCLVATILLIIFLLAGISFLLDHFYYRKIRRELKRDINAPAPLFPLEPKNRE